MLDQKRAKKGGLQFTIICINFQHASSGQGGDHFAQALDGVFGLV
jgi:hypothetical protein